MYLTLLFFVFPLPVQAYSFCPKCIHSSGAKDRCDLFKQHPLFKDVVEANFIGKEICGEKGKYFRCGDDKDKENEKEDNKEDDVEVPLLFQEKIMRMVRD